MEFPNARSNMITRINEFVNNIFETPDELEAIEKSFIQLLCEYSWMSVSIYEYYSTNTNGSIAVNYLDQLGGMPSFTDIDSIVVLFPFQISERVSLIARKMVDALFKILNQKTSLQDKKLTAHSKRDSLKKMWKEEKMIKSQMLCDYKDAQECADLLRSIITSTLSSSGSNVPKEIAQIWTPKLRSVTAMGADLEIVVNKSSQASTVRAAFVQPPNPSSPTCRLFRSYYIPILESTKKVMDKRRVAAVNDRTLTQNEKWVTAEMMSVIFKLARTALQISEVFETIFKKDERELQKLNFEITEYDKRMTMIKNSKDTLLVRKLKIKKYSDYLENLYSEHEGLIDSFADQ